jgi:hypothetical protein
MTTTFLPPERTTGSNSISLAVDLCNKQLDEPVDEAFSALKAVEYKWPETPSLDGKGLLRAKFGIWD